jgi:ComF family protein
MIRAFLSTYWQAIIEVMFPSCCVACNGKLLQEEQVICSSCLSSIVRTEHHILPNNGIDMLFEELIHNSTQKIRYERGGAFAYYNRKRGHVLRTLIERGKFGISPNPQIFYLLGRLAAQEWIDAELWDGVDLLVPVPLHDRRLRERGFNQSEWICRGISDVLHIPMDIEHLVRFRNNPHQSRSMFRNREKNVADVFAIRHPEEWKGKHILLVDDVITSGSTILSCIKQASPIRGCRVNVFALGWAHN